MPAPPSDTRRRSRSSGELIDRRFRIVETAGDGAFGSVYRATDAATLRDVALKVLDRGSFDRARFEREAEALATIHDPHVVAYIAHGVTDEGPPYLAMEWLEGIDLARRIGRGPVSVREALVIAARTAQGLAAAHRLGIIHRDIKPSNIFLVGDRAEDVRVIDFGIARVPTYAKLTATGTLIGTPGYMSPEQARGAMELRPSVDVFALGCVLFECLVGFPPFLEPSDSALFTRLLSGHRSRVSEHRSDVPAVLDVLLSRMLAHDERDRFVDADAVAIAVSALLSEGTLSSALYEGPIVTERSAPRFESTRAEKPRPALAGDGLEPGFVGRKRELAILEGTWQEVAGERCARVALLVGEAGIGKSRLLGEFLERLAPAVRPLRAFSDRPTSTSPFSTIRQLLHSLDSASSARRLQFAEALTETERDFLCELAGLRPDDSNAPHLQAARRDPMLMADAFCNAWLALIAAKLSSGPVIIAIEDLPDADPASVHLVEASLRQFASCPLLVVASARQADDSSAIDLFGSCDPETILLKPLRPAIAAELLRAVIPQAAPAELDQIVASLSGNPLGLIERARSGAVALPTESAQAAIFGRLARLEFFAMRVLRAASVFGARFEFDGLLPLLGGESRRNDIAAALRLAAADHFVVPPATGSEWSFRHGLVQECAYATLDPAERRDAHAAAGQWLAGQQPADPSVIAWHYEHAELRAHAFEWYEAAARAALLGRDLERAVRLSDAAVACQPEPHQLARVALIRAEASFHRGDSTAGKRDATAAMSSAKPGSLIWMSAAGVLVTSAGQRGDNGDVVQLASVVREQEPEQEAVAQRVVCLCRAGTQLLSIGEHAAASGLLREAEKSGCTDPLAQAWLNRLAATLSSLDHDYDVAIEMLGKAVLCYSAAGDLRGACQARIFRASGCVFTGDFETAVRELDIAEQVGRRSGADYFVRWASYTRGKVLALTGDPVTARDHLARVRNELTGNPRIVAGTHIYTALAALRARDGAWAETEAKASLEAHHAPATRAVGLAALARGLVLGGRPAEALEASNEACAILDAIERVEENENLIHLAAIEAALACGREEDARATAMDALARLRAIANKLATSSRREAYLHGIDTHAQILSVAFRLGLSLPSELG